MYARADSGDNPMLTKDNDLSALSRAPSNPTEPPRAKMAPPRFRWRTRVLLPAVILLTVSLLIGYTARDALWPATPVTVVPVILKASAAAPVGGSVLVQAPGWVEADPFAISVSALADGVVSEVLVLEGEPVAQGQIVARLIDDDARLALARTQAMLAARESALTVAKAKLAEAERNWEHPIELTRRLDTATAHLAEKQAELDRWPYELAREEAHAVYLEAEFKRVETVRERGSASDIEVVRASQNHAAQQAQVEVIRKREAILKAQLLALKAELKAAGDDLDLRITDTRALAEARAAVRLAEATVASSEVMRDEAVLRLSRMEVRSPATGLVMTRLAEPGSKLMLQMDDPRSAQVVRLYDPAKLQVRVDIPLVDAAKVGVGQRAEIIVDVLPDRVYLGRVSRIVHEADVQKNTLQVKVAIENPTSELKPEMLARARFLAGGDSTGSAGSRDPVQQVFVPRSAIVKRDGQTLVWLADQVSNVARLEPVTLGSATLGDSVVVFEGLRSGDRVIVDAPEDLVVGQRIRLIER